MRTIKLVPILVLLSIFFISCGDEPETKNIVVTSEIDSESDIKAQDLKGNINKSITLKSGTDYLLTGSLKVKSGAVLTIEPGTTIKAKAGSTDVFLAVERGAKLIANGTADKPIEFKSNSSDPATGDWGGIVIAGKARTNKGAEADTEVAGLKYGGTDDTDNSGVMTYIKVSHTGAKINGDAEFNGLSLYTIGSKTKIENIFISNGADDGIEFFGGTVNVTNLICVNIKDDMFDFTGGYTGTITNAFGVRESGFIETTEDPRGIEGDSNSKNITATPVSSPTFNKVTILNLSKGQNLKAGAEIRRGTKAIIKNALFAAAKGASFGNLIDTKDDSGDGSLTISEAFKNGSVGENKTDKTITGEIKLVEDALTLKDGMYTLKTGLGADFNLFSWTGYTSLKE